MVYVHYKILVHRTFVTIYKTLFVVSALSFFPVCFFSEIFKWSEMLSFPCKLISFSAVAQGSERVFVKFYREISNG